jgi:hypothetical protein
MKPSKEIEEIARKLCLENLYEDCSCITAETRALNDAIKIWLDEHYDPKE